MDFHAVQSEFNQSAASRCALVCPLIKSAFSTLNAENALPANKNHPVVADIYAKMAESLASVETPSMIRQMTTEQLIRMRFDFETLSDNFVQYFYKNPVEKKDGKKQEDFWKLTIRDAPYKREDFQRAEKILSAVINMRLYEALPSWETEERWDAFTQAQKGFKAVFSESEKDSKIKAYTGYSSSSLLKRKAMLWGHDFLRTALIGRPFK